MKRVKLSTDREGNTTKFKVGPASVYVTVNCDDKGSPRELFAKADEGAQGEADGICLMASLALQYGAPPRIIVEKLRFRRYGIEGYTGQPCSISDAIGRALEAAL